MIALHVRYGFKPEDVDEAIRCFTAIQTATRREAGCLAYSAFRADDDPTSFWLHEEWESPAHLQAHFETEHFQRYSVGGLQKIAVVREITRGAPAAL
ncbi:MAG TPA: putative quinol monooxygenase [Candidatus Sulfotelmatobacter sp.]|nr:putative quinol monooxygenase [Candidatus Sulfotelmatobacter sp.]